MDAPLPPVHVSMHESGLWLAVARCRLCGGTLEEWGTDEEDACMELEGLALCMGWLLGPTKADFICAGCGEGGAFAVKEDG